MWFARASFAIALLTCVFAEELKHNSDRSDYKRSFAKDCDNTFSLTCLKLNIVGWVDKLNENENLSVFPGVSIVRENASAAGNNAEVVADLAREFPNDPDKRLDAFLLNKVQGFLNSHSIKVNFGGEEPEDENAVVGRKKKGRRGGGMGMMFAAAAMMKSTLFAIGMGALAALAGKALMTSLIALMLSAIIGLKSLSGGDSKTTYEVVSKPVYTHSSSHSSGHEDYHHGSGGYGRSFDVMPLPLGLQPGYKPA
ncbi:uncharacterized protein LOC114324589 [Diabrotica virgifera virgifera]|uniref:Uncharacterized protein LOC114324589 n=1 Tax=Diabrotica virgifera virgifera TaxID=50390 RepID=A0A6P7F068_DIAVI|nr:uncharacterized protein LOC114324589 [Diabrotica virgifera virgifera]